MSVSPNHQQINPLLIGKTYQHSSTNDKILIYIGHQDDEGGQQNQNSAKTFITNLRNYR